jgi:hypothetical protein
MGTSGSSEAWSATASIYSGRPDPEWTVPADVAGRLASAWDRLSDVPERRQAEPPGLGYRGCTLTAPDGRRWHAYGGVVVLRAGALHQAREDVDRAFEKALLATAPAGAIPASLPTEGGRRP